MKYLKYFLAAVAVIVVDQVSKLLVYHYMQVEGAEINVLGEWFRLHYLLNPGMAFGMKLDWEWGKLLLTLFRLFATIGIGWYMVVLVRKKAATGLIWCMALILGGAVGNLVDSIFYGIFIPGNLIEDAPFALFHGQVIDMLYFPLYQGFLPDWVPGNWGGKYFEFFRPVFNLADSAIFIGVALILIFQKRYFADNKKEADADTNTPSQHTEQAIIS